jgi:hypothetical protein
VGSTCLVASLLAQGVPIRDTWAEDDAAETAAARSLAVEGIRLADAGKCADAIEKLARAEKLHHAPIPLSRLGECQIAQGKLVDGTENLRKVLREPLPPNPSPALTKARERAQAALDAAKPKIAFLTITVKGPPNNTATTVTVDGQPVSSALLDTERPSDPGEHVIEATAQGFLKGTAKVTLGTGDKQSVTLKLESDPNYVPPAPPSEPGAGATRGAGSFEANMLAGRDAGTSGGSYSAPNRVPAYVVLAIGGSALVVGGLFGAVALKGKNDLENSCVHNQCSDAYDGQLKSAKLAGTVSTIAFIAGGVGIAAGTVLYFTAGSGSSERSGRASQAPRIAPRAFVGLGQVGLGADF